MNNNFIDVLEKNGAETKSTLERFLGDQELYYSFLKEYLVKESLEKLFAAEKANNYEEMSKIIHTIKGVALNLGITPLAKLSIEILKDYHSNNFDEMKEKITLFTAEFEHWISIVESL